MLENGRGLMRIIGVVGKKRSRNQLNIFIPSKINKLDSESCYPDIPDFDPELFSVSDSTPTIIITPTTPEIPSEERNRLEPRLETRLTEERNREERNREERNRLTEERNRLTEERNRLTEEKKRFAEEKKHFSSETIERRYTTVEIQYDGFKQKLENLINTFPFPNEYKKRIHKGGSIPLLEYWSRPKPINIISWMRPSPRA